MAIRTGAAYIEELKARQNDVVLRGKTVPDVTQDPAFAGAVRAVAELYDHQHHPDHMDDSTFVDQDGRHSLAFLAPTSRQDLTRCYRHYLDRSRFHYGMLGRPPDSLNANVTSWYLARHEFGAVFGSAAKDRLDQYYRFVRDRDLFLTHFLVSPAVPRGAESESTLRRVGETADGIVVRGAKILGTNAPIAEEALVMNSLRGGEHQDAGTLMFGVSVNAPGLRLYARPPMHSIDGPGLLSRYEEPDAVAIFHDVVVPWDRVIVDGSPGSSERLGRLAKYGKGTLSLQLHARQVAVMELISAVAMAVCEATGASAHLHVQERLGEMLSFLEIQRSVIDGSIANARPDEHGTFTPEITALRAMRLQAHQMYARMVETLQVTAGAAFFYAPRGHEIVTDQSAADWGHILALPTVDRIQRRGALMRLAWELCGEAFGQRLQQYTRYFSGDPFRNTAGFFCDYDKTSLRAQLDRALSADGV